MDMRESTVRGISLDQQNKPGHERRESQGRLKEEGERGSKEDGGTPCSQMAEVGSEAGEGKGSLWAGEV